MTVAAGPPSVQILRTLHQQLNILVAVLTVAELDGDVAVMMAGLADTTGAAEALLTGIDPAVLVEIRSAFARVRAGQRDDVRADLLMASRRLAVLLHQDRPRRAAAAHEPTLRWSLDL